MNTERAEGFAQRIVGATSGWSPEAVGELVRLIEEWTDLDATDSAVEWVVHAWTERGHPPLGWIYRAYNEAREAERRANEQPVLPITDFIHPREGREIAYAEYRRTVGLPDDPATRARFEAGGVGAWGNFVESAAPDEDVVKAIAAVGAKGAMYVEVLRSFGGDHLRAGRALRALEKSHRIDHSITGWIVPRGT
jgi:hypothetical protein